MARERLWKQHELLPLDCCGLKRPPRPSHDSLWSRKTGISGGPTTSCYAITRRVHFALAAGKMEMVRRADIDLPYVEGESSEQVSKSSLRNFKNDQLDHMFL